MLHSSKNVAYDDIFDLCSIKLSSSKLVHVQEQVL